CLLLLPSFPPPLQLISIFLTESFPALRAWSPPRIVQFSLAPSSYLFSPSLLLPNRSLDPSSSTCLLRRSFTPLLLPPRTLLTLSSVVRFSLSNMHTSVQYSQNAGSGA